MSCINAYFSGWGECSAMMEKMNGLILQEKGKTWTDSTILAISNWKTEIADDDSAIRSAMPFPIEGFENTTDDVEIITSQLGKKSIGSKPIPSGLIYLSASICDYKELHQLEGKAFEFLPTFQDGSVWATRKSDGTLKGFRVRVGTKAGLPPEDKSQSYPLYLFFDSYQEFEDVVLITPDFNFSDILDLVPVGLSMRITTAYAAGDVVVKVIKRCTDEGFTGLVGGDFEVMSSNGTPPVAVTGVNDDGLGQYTLTIKKSGTPTDLTSGDYAVIQAHDDDGTYLTYLSNTIKVTV